MVGGHNTEFNTIKESRGDAQTVVEVIVTLEDFIVMDKFMTLLINMDATHLGESVRLIAIAH